MSSPCPRHPSHPLVGVCASCLREKLGTFVDEEEEEEEEGGGGLGGDNGSFGSSPIVKKAIDNGSYVHDSPTKMGASVAANELQAPAMESNTCPQVGFPSLTRSLSFNEISAKLSPIPTAQKRTLSYYLDLYKEGGASSALNSHKTTISSKRVNHHSPLCASYNAAYGGNEEKKHGSLSSTGLRNPMIVVCESGTPLSWLSALFSRRREKQEAKSRQAWRGCSSGGGCEGAYESSSSSISWEAPGPSSCREQLSSWENPTPSSWQLPSIQNSHPTRAYEAAAHNPTIASQKEELNQRIGHGFAAETKPKPHWNEVWTKTLLSNKWAIKLKSGLNKKSQQPGADSDDDRASTMSAASSSASHQHHSQNQNSVQNHSRRTQQNSMSKRQMKTSQDEAHQYRRRELGGSRRDYGAWDFYYGPVHSTSFESNHKSNSARSGDSGLLRFYLTPVRGTGFRGKGKQRAHHH